MQISPDLSGTASAELPAIADNNDELGPKSAEVVYDWDILTDEITWGPDYQNLLGLPPASEVMSGLGYAEHLAAESPSSRYETVMSSAGCDTGGGVPFTTVYGLVEAKRSKAAPVWIEDSGRWFADVNDRPCRVHGLIRIITERFEAERLQMAASQRDPLTGAFTRAHFIEHVARHLSLVARKTSTFALLLIEIELADSPERGDETWLAEAVDRLRAQMRTHEVLARYAGTKFAALLENCTDVQAAAAAQRLAEGVVRVVPEAPLFTVRIGAVMAPCRGRTPQALLQFAEEALEAARQPSSMGYVLYEPTLTRATARPVVSGADEILSALEEGRITLALQPIVNARTRNVAFFEGLVRVTRLDGPPILPDTLVPNAEKNGLVPLIDRRVIELAFALLTADRKLVLSINASVASLGDPSWFDQLRMACRMRSDAARRLTIEVTETCAIADLEQTRLILTAVKALGVKIAIDDFGSGHSSFRNLRQLPIDYLKIDGAFAQNLASSQDDRFFIRTLIDLARNLQVPTVVEWVEDEASAQILADWGVTYLQGYLFGKPELAPMPAVTRRALSGGSVSRAERT